MRRLLVSGCRGARFLMRGEWGEEGLASAHHIRERHSDYHAFRTMVLFPDRLAVLPLGIKEAHRDQVISLGSPSQEVTETGLSPSLRDLPRQPTHC